MVETLQHLETTVQIHLVAAVLSVALAPLQLVRRRRDIWHRRFGYVWVAAMAATALSSFWITDIRLIGPFSPIHGLSVLVLWSLTQAIRAARAGNIEAHSRTMQSMAWWALGVAGLFTLLPGRFLNEAIFGAWGEPGFAATAVIAVSAALYARQRRNKAAQAASDATLRNIRA